MSSTKNNIFKFKHFAVDQTDCAMKVNTDGVLLGVLANAVSPKNILDIGTGTGVIALILAQRFSSAKITAVEIDEKAACTASNNFESSIFIARLQLFHSSFEDYFQKNRGNKFDLIISNPPFFIDSLRSDNVLKGIARHTNRVFFENMLRDSANNLESQGELILIVPVTISGLIQKLSLSFGLYLQKKISICSFSNSLPHREILTFGRIASDLEITRFCIYSQPKIYSEEYKHHLKDFLIIF